MSIRIKKNSRLRFSQLRVIDGVEFWDYPEWPELPIQDDDVSHTVKQGDRSDTIANTYYGDPALWWVVSLANGLDLMPTYLNEGDALRIPSPRYVLQEVFKKAVT